jgi:hypothetical protein
MSPATPTRWWLAVIAAVVIVVGCSSQATPTAPVEVPLSPSPGPTLTPTTIPTATATNTSAATPPTPTASATATATSTATATPTLTPTPTPGRLVLDPRGMPVQIEGQPVYEGYAVSTRLNGVFDTGQDPAFLVLGRVIKVKADCVVPADFPKTPLLRPCHDGLSLRTTRYGVDAWFNLVANESLGSLPMDRPVVLRVHVKDPRADGCARPYYRLCQEAVVVDELVWSGAAVQLPAAGDSTPPVGLAQEVTKERYGLRVDIRLGRNPLLADAPNVALVEITNIGAGDVTWLYDGCGVGWAIRGEMPGSAWPAGAEQAGRLAAFKQTALDNEHSASSIDIGFGWFGVMQPASTCADIGIEETLAAGASWDRQLFWDGFAEGWDVGPPSDGWARLNLYLSNFTRAGGSRQDWQVTADHFAWVPAGAPRVSPAEAVDIALAEPGFGNAIATDMWPNTEPVMWFDPDLAAWEVGVYDYTRHVVHAVFVDAETGQVVLAGDIPFCREVCR